jgi:hypothetical protein
MPDNIPSFAGAGAKHEASITARESCRASDASTQREVDRLRRAGVTQSGIAQDGLLRVDARAWRGGERDADRCSRTKEISHRAAGQA